MPNYREIHSFILKKSINIPHLNNILKKNGIIRIKTETMKFFDFIFKTIISQQISFKTSEAIWRRVENFLLVKELDLIKSISEKKNCEEIQKMGVSGKKIEYLKIFKDNNPNINREKNYYKKLSETEFKNIFKKNKGIGDWSCDMIQIFYFNKLNIWPNNDLIINKHLEEITKKYKQNFDFKKIFDPYLSIIALHIWKYSD